MERLMRAFMRASNHQRPQVSRNGRDSLVSFAQRLVRTPSLSTQEGEVALAVQEELARQKDLRFLVIDFARVHGLDASAIFSLGKLSRLCTAAGVRLILSGLPRYQDAHYRAFAGSNDRALFTDTLDDALQSFEAGLLSTRPESAPDTASLLLNDLLALSERPQCADKFKRVTLNTGDVLLNQGAESREMFVLLSGAMRAEVARQDGDPLVVRASCPALPSAKSHSMAARRASPPSLPRSLQCW